MTDRIKATGLTESELRLLLRLLDVNLDVPVNRDESYLRKELVRAITRPGLFSVDARDEQ